MKAYSRRARDARICAKAEELVTQETERIYYESFRSFAPDVIRQTLAAVLYALSLHGYGEHRLRRIVAWFDALKDLPDVFGQTPTCQDCVAYIRSRYGIDLSTIQPRLESYEEYKHGKR